MCAPNLPQLIIEGVSHTTVHYAAAMPTRTESAGTHASVVSDHTVGGMPER